MGDLSYLQGEGEENTLINKLGQSSRFGFHNYVNDYDRDREFSAGKKLIGPRSYISCHFICIFISECAVSYFSDV